MLCWLLYKVFPTEEESNRFPSDFRLETSKNGLKSSQFEKIATSYLPTLDKSKKSKKMDENHIKKKFTISQALYRLIKSCCHHNEINLDYVFKFINYYESHIGHGIFVSEALEGCLYSEKILKKLSYGNYINKY